MAYEIEDVPVRKKEHYPFADMRSGQSFVVPDNNVQLVRMAASAHHRRGGRKFVVRKGYDGIYRCGLAED